MALYTTLQDSGQDAVSASTLGSPLISTKGAKIIDPSMQESGPKIVPGLRWHGILYGFKPTLVYVICILATLVTLNVRWVGDGTMGFGQLDQHTLVKPSNVLSGPGLLLASRVVWLLATIIPLGLSVAKYRRIQQAKGEPLVLGGFEILLIFCTLWTWCCLGLYFILATIASGLYVGLAWLPGSTTTSLLWVLFDICFGMSWLVFWTCWFILIPFAHVMGQRAMVNELLSPAVLYLHNVNVIIMMGELLCSSWTVNMEHCIFPVYFGIAYVFFNWWLHSKLHWWIYFFLDYDRPSSVPVCLVLVVLIVASFWIGTRAAAFLGKG